MATEPNRPAPVDPETQATPAGVAADLEEEAEAAGASTDSRDVDDIRPLPEPEDIVVDDGEAGD